MPVYEKCKVFTCNHTCNLHVIIECGFMVLSILQYNDFLASSALAGSVVICLILLQMSESAGSNLAGFVTF